MYKSNLLYLLGTFPIHLRVYFAYTRVLFMLEVIKKMPRPHILLLQSDDELCSRLAILLKDFFTVHVCERPTQAFPIMYTHKCEYAFLCGSYCNPTTIDWAKMIATTLNTEVRGVYVSQGWLNNPDAVSRARHELSELADCVVDDSAFYKGVIELVSTSLDVEASWAA